jgi:hypothetical protein
VSPSIKKSTKFSCQNLRKPPNLFGRANKLFNAISWNRYLNKLVRNKKGIFSYSWTCSTFFSFNLFHFYFHFIFLFFLFSILRDINVCIFFSDSFFYDDVINFASIYCSVIMMQSIIDFLFLCFAVCEWAFDGFYSCFEDVFFLFLGFVGEICNKSFLKDKDTQKSS